MVAVKFPLRDANGRITGIGCCVQDITERKGMERALRESEARLRGFMDHAPMLISLKDRDERYRLVNRELTDFLDKSASEIIGRTVHDLFPRHIAERLSADDRAVLATGTVISREFSETETYDRYAEVFVTKFPIRNDQGEIVGVGGITQDISQRKQAERALRESEARLRSFMEFSPVGMMVKDLDRRVLMINRRSAANLGREPDEIVGHRTTDFLNERHAEIVTAHERRVLESGASVEMEFHFPGRSAVEWTHEVKFPIRDANGTMVALGGIISDITERKRSEIALKESQLLWQSFMDNSPFGMSIKDLDRRFLSVNRRAAETLRAPPGKILGRRTDEILPTKVPARLRTWSARSPRPASRWPEKSIFPSVSARSGLTR
jgi:PAS domain S-box-containing protein